MNPLNSHLQQTQYFLTTAMPSMAPGSSTSNAKATAQTVANLTSGVPTSSNNILCTNNFVTTANYVPVLLTNQTLFTGVDPMQQQHSQQQSAKVPSSVMSVASSPVVPTTNMTSLMSSNKQSVVFTSCPTGNITYQVLAPPTQNLGSVLAGQNGTLNVLVTSAPSSGITSATGHNAAPFILSNAASSLSTLSSSSGNLSQFNKQESALQQNQMPHQVHQQMIGQSFNTQQINKDILKQIVVGPKSSSAETAAKALLKSNQLLPKPKAPSLAPKTPYLTPKTHLNNEKKTNTLTTQQKSILTKMQKPSNNAIDRAIKVPEHFQNAIAKDKSSKQSTIKANNNNNITKPKAQKKPLVSLLPNSQNHSMPIVPRTNISSTTASGGLITANSNQMDEIYEEKLSSEVSIIKKIKTDGDTTKLTSATSLLKTKSQNNRNGPLVDKKTDPIASVGGKLEYPEINESDKKFTKDAAHVSISCVNSSKNIPSEKQQSLLKGINAKNSGTLLHSSQRNHRSNSCTLTSKSNIKTAQAHNNCNERRHSEPFNIDITPTPKSPSMQSIVENDECQDVTVVLLQSPDNKAVASAPNTADSIDDVKSKPANANDDPQSPDRNQILQTPKKVETQPNSTDADSDDDVTILPTDESFIEPIEIEDDDETPVADTYSEHESSNSQTVQEKEKHNNESLLCDEQILVSSSSSASNMSAEHLASSLPSPNLRSAKANTCLSIAKKLSLSVKEEQRQGYSTVLDMLSNYNMLNWRERVGTARGTDIKFQLNEFNLVQVHEKVPYRSKDIYERPVYERTNLQTEMDIIDKEPHIYYMCRRCNVKALAINFIAPEFCSISCVRRDSRKRRQDGNPCILRKKQRYSVAASHPPPLKYISQPKFRWSSYLKANYTAIAAPITLFLNSFPTGPNSFKVGMKLEAIDPENCSLFCVCTIVDISGYRLKLSFDGYDTSYDFWLNADSMDIFPPGWCSKTNRILQPPKGISGSKFNWNSYLNKDGSVPAPREIFTHLNSSSIASRNPFKIGMHLEAEDLNDTGKLCVASVADVLDDRIRIHFDGWDDCYDIIVDINSPYIHPCGFHDGRQQLVVPPDCENLSFNWDEYIRKQGSGIAAGDELFSPREPIYFKPNMKLEVVDPRNSSLIRPATVVSHKGHRVKLHLDGWPNDYCFWLEDDSPDLHPIGWSDATGHDLEPPPGFLMPKQKMPCPITGCRGIGNAKRPLMSLHATRDSCPYAAENWRIVLEKPPRVNNDEIFRLQVKTETVCSRLIGKQILEKLQILDSIPTRGSSLQLTEMLNNINSIGACSNFKHEDESDEHAEETGTTEVKMPTTEVELEIAREFLCDYGPRLRQNYTLWQKNVTLDVETIKRNPMSWSVNDVGVFIGVHLKNKETAAKFVEEDIDGQAFLLLQQDELTDRLGLKIGPAVKLHSCILQLRVLAVTKFNLTYCQPPRK